MKISVSLTVVATKSTHASFIPVRWDSKEKPKIEVTKCAVSDWLIFTTQHQTNADHANIE